MSLSIVVPVYNEEECLEEFLDELYNKLKTIEQRSEIIIVNDGSSDRSKEILEKYKDFKDIKIIDNPYNRGYGISLKTGIKNAAYEWICIIDADGTYPIDEIKKMYELTDKYDMVVGARIGEKVNIPFIRKPAKLVLTLLANYIVGSKIPDLNSGLRIFKKDTSLKYFNILPSGFSFTTTITIAHMTDDYLVYFHKINYLKRKGKSKIRALKHTSQFLLLLLRLIMYFKPLKIFFPIGGFALIAGILKFFYDNFISYRAPELSIIMILASIQIIFIGLVADMIVKSRNK